MPTLRVHLAVPTTTETVDKRALVRFMTVMLRRVPNAPRKSLGHKSLGFSAGLSAVFLSSAAYAGGYFIGPIGGQAVGRSGAFVAKANDLSAAYYNPAGFALTKGTRLQLDNKFSYNTVQFQRESFTDSTGLVTNFAPVASTPKFQPLDPLVGVATDFGLSEFAFGLVAYANSGISQMQFPVDGGQRYMMTERNAMFINYSLSAAWRPSPDFSIGLSPQVIAVPELTYQLVVNGTGSALGISPITNPYDILATVKGKDLFTLNAILGAWYRPVPNIELGLSAQVLPSKIVTDGPIALSFANPGVTFEGPDLIRNRLPATDINVSIELPLPMWAKLGGRYVERDANGAEVFDIELDVTYERWSTVKRFVVDTKDLVARAGGNEVPLGTINVEKQWQDVIGVSVGGDYAAVPDLLQVRAGGYFETAVAKPEFSSVDFVTGQQIGLTAGGSLLLGGFSLSLGYEFRFQPDVTIATANGQVAQVVPDAPGARVIVNGGTYSANSHSAVLGLGFAF